MYVGGYVRVYVRGWVREDECMCVCVRKYVGKDMCAYVCNQVCRDMIIGLTEKISWNKDASGK